jgi:hypothetical protein
MNVPITRVKTRVVTWTTVTALAFCFLAVPAFPQNVVDSFAHRGDTIVVAGKQYHKGSFYQWLWGKHYRQDWLTQVRVKMLNLDTVNGGLIAYEKGGGRQSITIRLRNVREKEYVLRSIDKSFGLALPEIYRKTFVESLINDQVSMAEPYSALTIAPMAEAAGIYHTNPEIVYVPVQKGMGELFNQYADKLYLFEQRPDENWEEASNFGNSKKIVSTEKMLKEILEQNDHQVDQLFFIKARLFDMVIGDWGRQEDQWRWATLEDGDKKIYRAIPRDRDQAYTKLDGVLIGFGASAASGHLETYGPSIKNVSTYNFPARNLDRKLANELTKEDWLKTARELKNSLTDAVIENAVKQLPPEVYPLSGAFITQNLKARRDRLEEFASGYYASLAKEVEITGTSDNELFVIKPLDAGQTEIKAFDLNKEGQPKKKPFYSRVFSASETKEIRIYGIAGDDRYVYEGNKSTTIKIRLIGGPGNDTYNIDPHPRAGKLQVYDSRFNEFNGSFRKHLSDDPFIHLYEYKSFEYDSKGIAPALFYDSRDHIYAGLRYRIEKKQWRKHPYGRRHELGVNYSFSEQAFSTFYEGSFTELIGKWGLELYANYDWVRWNNFYGIGNETKMLTTGRDFHRVRSKELMTHIGLRRKFAHFNEVAVYGLYQTVNVIHDKGRFLTEHMIPQYNYDLKKFAGGRIEYTYQKLDNVKLPEKGILFTVNGSYLQNIEKSDSSVISYNSQVQFYVPLPGPFILSVKAGGASLSGKPEFYQLHKLGGGRTLRGYRKYRFYGESMAYNQNEIQFVKDVRSFLYNGKLGFFALYDIGRVWQPGEISGTWHTGYGGGIILVPFNKIAFKAAYAFGSGNEQAFSLLVSKSF